MRRAHHRAAAPGRARHDDRRISSIGPRVFGQLRVDRQTAWEPPRSRTLAQARSHFRANLQMSPEPFASKASNFFECSVFLEQMRRTRDDLKLLLAAQAREGFLVHPDDRFVQAANDEQSRRLNAR